jgi:hypothetical protein
MLTGSRNIIRNTCLQPCTFSSAKCARKCDLKQLCIHLHKFSRHIKFLQGEQAFKPVLFINSNHKMYVQDLLVLLYYFVYLDIAERRDLKGLSTFS